MTPKYRRGPTRPAIPRVNRLAAASIRFSLCRTARTDVCQPRRAFYVGRQRSFLSIEVGIVQWLLFPVAILAGMLMVVQSGCNGMLERILDRPVMVGVVSQALGLTTLVFAGIATGELGFPDSSRIMQGPCGHGSVGCAALFRCCRSRLQHRGSAPAPISDYSSLPHR